MEYFNSLMNSNLVKINIDHEKPEVEKPKPKKFNFKFWKKDEDEAKEEKKGPPLKKVLALNKPELSYIIVGCLASVVSGAVQPAYAVMLSKATGVSLFRQRKPYFVKWFNLI